MLGFGFHYKVELVGSLVGELYVNCVTDWRGVQLYPAQCKSTGDCSSFVHISDWQTLSSRECIL